MASHAENKGLSFVEVIHKAGFRSLGKGELVEFEPRLSCKGIEATFVCGIGGVKCRGSDRRPISREKFQDKPVQLQQRQPQRRQSQAELQQDRFHRRSGRSTCNITSRPVDDSAVYTVRPLVDGPARARRNDIKAAKPQIFTPLDDICLLRLQNQLNDAEQASDAFERLNGGLLCQSENNCPYGLAEKIKVFQQVYIRENPCFRLMMLTPSRHHFERKSRSSRRRLRAGSSRKQTSQICVTPMTCTPVNSTGEVRVHQPSAIHASAKEGDSAIAD
ncbi:hypothetical protein C0Q70_07667 [Pomacea canaliculata]|uniref:Uncharacterized protein n=1 Tax=Pomacea canaliculata TaxID=400727 RepID=A0A2T7PFN8_POMCA|nr:hypothetical protein C0Q70_07667 [Pomacea canaliculata]